MGLKPVVIEERLTKMNIKNILFLCLLFFFVTPVAYSDDTKIRRFAQDFNLTTYEADVVLGKLSRVVRKVQKVIMYVADSDNSKKDKLSMIDYAVEHFFVSERSMIGISSLNRKQIKRRTIREYLEHLALLSDEEYGKYNDVKIYFGEKILLEGIGEVSKNTARIDTSTFQFFRGCYSSERQRCYSDVTKKMFSTNININRRNIESSEAKLDEINVVDTYTFKSSLDSDGITWSKKDYDVLRKLQ